MGKTMFCWHMDFHKIVKKLFWTLTVSLKETLMGYNTARYYFKFLLNNSSDKNMYKLEYITEKSAFIFPCIQQFAMCGRGHIAVSQLVGGV